ncbi:MAG: site-2 protease family protein [Rhodospirillales bacterium]
MSEITQILYQISVMAIPVLVAITFHEAAHGWVACRLGDDTAQRLGRVTFNPLRHIDPFGTVVLPAMLLLATQGQAMFGFAKPVPVNFHRLHRPRFDMVLVAAAGPGINLLLALVSAMLLNGAVLVPDGLGDWLANVLVVGVFFNVLLAVFNMLPLPPLDGGRVAVGVLPDVVARPLANLERYGFIIIIAALFLLPFIGSKLGLDLDLFQWLVFGPAERLTGVILRLAGAG